VIDLHLHSKRSDGTDTPTELVTKAAAVRFDDGSALEAIALTDHDTTAGLAEARVAAESFGLRLIGGCEVSAKFKSKSVHVLSYFIEDDSPMQTMLDELRHDRRVRNERLVVQLNEGLGLERPLSFAELAELAGGEEGIGRPHFATLLLERGVAETSQELFDKYLGDQGAYYVAKSHLPPKAVIDKAAESGGVAVLAHPLLYGWSEDQLDGYLEELSRDGLVGVETYYSRFNTTQVALLERLAAEYGLVTTGGSDYHGSVKKDLSIGRGMGGLEVARECLDALEARRPTN
jgi:predicted metal-dependent phosphoesterase TrpH